MLPTTKRKYLVIINPASGIMPVHRSLPRVHKYLTRYKIDFDMVFTRYGGHAAELARDAAAKGYYAVLACGGDGTVNEVARALAGTDTVMGIIPNGSGNGLARHLGIPVDISRSIRVIAADNVINADHGTANGQPFFCTFGVGFDAAVSERCAREKHRGIIMYLKNGISEYLKFKPEDYTIDVDGNTITERAFLVVACNASQYGNNTFIAPQASITDGMLDIVIVHAGNLMTHAIMGFDMLTGLIRNNVAVTVIRTSKAHITRHGEGSAHIDGDAVTMPDSIDIEIVPGTLRIFAPTDDTRFKPFITPTVLFMRDCIYRVRQMIPLSPKEIKNTLRYLRRKTRNTI